MSCIMNNNIKTSWDDDERSLKAYTPSRTKCSSEDTYTSLGDILKQYYQETSPFFLYGFEYTPEKHIKNKKTNRIQYITQEESNINIDEDEIISDANQSSDELGELSDITHEESDNQKNELNADILENIAYKNSWYS